VGRGIAERNAVRSEIALAPRNRRPTIGLKTWRFAQMGRPS
jgi:hypothetical protein